MNIIFGWMEDLCSKNGKYVLFRLGFHARKSIGISTKTGEFLFFRVILSDFRLYYFRFVCNNSLHFAHIQE